MGNNPQNGSVFFASGFLYNPMRNEILLHLRDGNTTVNPHMWGFFGGSSEDGESAKECCIREWHEELGILVQESDLIPLCDYLNTERNTWRYVFYMESDMPKEQMTLGEGADFDWIALEKVFEYNLTEMTRRDLQYFIKLIKK